jgi:ubiquinone/menaquinone biosynthesis C-methylase UbiE
MSRPPNDVQIWDKWNMTYRLGTLDYASERRMFEVAKQVAALNIRDAKILEAGCGTGWLSARLSEFGKVTAIDIGAKIIEIAQEKYPHIDFRSGDAESLDLPVNYFDIVVSSQVLAHVVDQRIFVHRLAELLKPGGYVMIDVQNKYVFDRTANIDPPDGWIRKWVTMKELKDLLRPDFSIVSATTVEPEGHLGFLRVVNSVRLNKLFGGLLGAGRVKRMKENAGFGQSLMIVGKKR